MRTRRLHWDWLERDPGSSSSYRNRKRYLANPTRAGQPIEVIGIGYAAGFADPLCFSRIFRVETTCQRKRSARSQTPDRRRSGNPTILLGERMDTGRGAWARQHPLVPGLEVRQIGI